MTGPAISYIANESFLSGGRERLIMLLCSDALASRVPASLQLQMPTLVCVFVQVWRRGVCWRAYGVHPIAEESVAGKHRSRRLSKGENGQPQQPPQ